MKRLVATKPIMEGVNIIMPSGFSNNIQETQITRRFWEKSEQATYNIFSKVKALIMKSKAIENCSEEKIADIIEKRFDKDAITIFARLQKEYGMLKEIEEDIPEFNEQKAKDMIDEQKEYIMIELRGELGI